MCVAAQSRSRVGLWQLSLRRGCADQDWAENQALAVLKGELHDGSPMWESYLLTAASSAVPSPWSPWGRICVRLTYPLTVCLTYSVPLCLSDLPPVCLWFTDWLKASVKFCLPKLRVCTPERNLVHDSKMDLIMIMITQIILCVHNKGHNKGILEVWSHMVHTQI